MVGNRRPQTPTGRRGDTAAFGGGFGAGRRRDPRATGRKREAKSSPTAVRPCAAPGRALSNDESTGQMVGDRFR
jgi:hypothetical protein